MVSKPLVPFSVVEALACFAFFFFFFWKMGRFSEFSSEHVESERSILTSGIDMVNKQMNL